MRRAPRVAALAALLLAASCGAPEGEGNAAAAAEPAAPAANGAEAAGADEAAAGPDIAVEAEGLRLVDEASGAARPLPFGMPQEQLLALLEGFRGPADAGTNPECGAGPVDYAVWADGLTLNFQESRFAGWALDERAAGSHATMSGIGPGSTRRELEAAHEVAVEQTSLGTEFTAGGIGGVLDGPGPDARITAMWAGVTCVFR